MGQNKITKKEKQFLEFVEYGWITKDSDTSVYYHKEKPHKEYTYSEDESGDWWCDNDDLDYVEENEVCIEALFETGNNVFNFIKSTDKYPWSVSDLLKLEVIGD